MSRQKKETLIQELKSQFSNSEAAFLVGYKGLTVDQMQKLRRGLRSKGGTFKVAKARLMRLAAPEMAQDQDLVPYFKDQIGIVFASQDTPGVLKYVHDFSKDNQALSFVVGCSDSKIIDKGTLIRMASLPSREVLLAMVCGTLKAPIVKLACVLVQIKEKKQ